jgi:hypothetical protein
MKIRSQNQLFTTPSKQTAADFHFLFSKFAVRRGKNRAQFYLFNQQDKQFLNHFSNGLEISNKIALKSPCKSSVCVYRESKKSCILCNKNRQQVFPSTKEDK